MRADDKTKPNVCNTMTTLLVQRNFHPILPILPENRYKTSIKTAYKIDVKIANLPSLKISLRRILVGPPARGLMAESGVPPPRANHIPADGD